MFWKKGNTKLKEALDSGSPIAVLFTGHPPPNSCGQRFVDPMPPVFDQTSKEFRDKVVCAKVDIFKDVPLTRDFGIRSIPTIVFLRGRAEIERFEGPISERTLRWYFERVMAPSPADADDVAEGDGETVGEPDALETTQPLEADHSS